jgi:hypothetical protein
MYKETYHISLESAIQSLFVSFDEPWEHKLLWIPAISLKLQSALTMAANEDKQEVFITFTAKRPIVSPSLTKNDFALKSYSVYAVLRKAISQNGLYTKQEIINSIKSLYQIFYHRSIENDGASLGIDLNDEMFSMVIEKYCRKEITDQSLNSFEGD